MSNDPLTFERVARTCGCGNAIETIVGKMAGRVVIHGAKMCDECVGEFTPTYELPVENREAKLAALLEAAGVNVKKHGDCTIESWEGVESNKPIQAANDFVREAVGATKADRVRGLYLCGDTGVGKSHLATGIVRAFLLSPRIDPARVVFDRASRLITEIQDTYNSGHTGKVLDKRERAQLWVLDDFGAEKATEDVLRILTDLMSAREGHANVLTSNYEPGQIAERWQSDGLVRLASRLGPENFLAVRVRGRDRRLSA